MLKLYQNEPYSTEHEHLQAKRLVEVLERKYAFGGQASLCLNFSFGGKALDAALVTPNGFVIIELKAVGGDVECGESMENCPWKWRGSVDGDFHEISTKPYVNPYSQVKHYRTAVINELEHWKTHFAYKKVVEFNVEIKFAHWVKGCVALSLRDATDVEVHHGELSENVKKWFCHGAISSIPELLDTMVCSETMSVKEVQRLITDVIGLHKVECVMERFKSENRGGPRDEETSVLHEEPNVPQEDSTMHTVESFVTFTTHEATNAAGEHVRFIRACFAVGDGEYRVAFNPAGVRNVQLVQRVSRRTGKTRIQTRFPVLVTYEDDSVAGSDIARNVTLTECPFTATAMTSASAAVQYPSVHITDKCKEEHKVAEEKADILKNRSEQGLSETENVLTGNVKAPSEKEFLSHDKSLVTYSEKALSPFVKVTLKQEMGDIAKGYLDDRDPCELKGNDAKELVERICPDIGSFEVSVVLRFGEMFPEESAGKIKKYFEQKFARWKEWHSIEYNQGYVYFIFGQAKSQGEIPIVQRPQQLEKTVNTRFLLPTWLKTTIDKKTEGLELLSALEVQTTDKLSSEDVRRYVKTYLPRSCAEAFVVFDNHLRDTTVDTTISLLDVGCGSGGASLGCLLALHKHKGQTGCRVAMNMADVNDEAMDVAENLFQQGGDHFEGMVIEKARRYTQTEKALFQSYDVIVASKSIGEMELKGGPGTFEKEMRKCAQRMKPDGVLIVIDIPKHKSALVQAVEKLRYEGFEGVVGESLIDIDNGNDQEHFVYVSLKRK